MVDKININNKQLLLNQKGQAVFELIIFLPFLLFLYSIYYTAGNSISGSINQQKAVRGYFYSLLKGNSYINTAYDLDDFAKKGIEGVGFSALGWREKADSGSENAYAPCFKFNSLLKNESTEECDSPEREEEGKSRYIRVFTFYGICGPFYAKRADDAGGKVFEINPDLQNNAGLCSLMASPP